MTIVTFVVSAALFLGAIVLMGYAWDGVAFSVPLFVGGIVSATASVMIPFHLLKRLDG